MRTALITGSEGAIGAALVTAFTNSGYRVVGLDLAVTSDVLGDDYAHVDLDRIVEDAPYRHVTLERLKEKIGAPGLAALVNNAAVQRVGRFNELSDRDWRETLNVNALAPMLLIRELHDELRKGGGSVVNISSIHATQTKPGFSAYAVSKAALTGLTRALALELGPLIRICAVAPAAIDTPMLRAGFSGSDAKVEQLKRCHPIGRIGRPDEVASLCVYLCSDAARFIHGTVFELDGGISARLHDPS